MGVTTRKLTVETGKVTIRLVETGEVTRRILTV